MESIFFRHDFKMHDDKMIDGGRTYIKTNCCETRMFKVLNGEFVEEVLE